MFLSPFLGYTVSAILSNLIHQRLGRRGVAFIGPACHLLAFAVISTNPPFPVLVIMYIFVGLGSGIQNAGWNVWISSLANSHEVLGCFHGFYGVGATVSPLVATTLITKVGWEWNTFYYLLVCIDISRSWPSSLRGRMHKLTSNPDWGRFSRTHQCHRRFLGGNRAQVSTGSSIYPR